MISDLINLFLLFSPLIICNALLGFVFLVSFTSRDRVLLIVTINFTFIVLLIWFFYLIFDGLCAIDGGPVCIFNLLSAAKGAILPTIVGTVSAYIGVYVREKLVKTK